MKHTITVIVVMIMGLTAVSSVAQTATNTETLQIQNNNEIRLYELGSNGSNYTSFKAAGSMSGDIKYTLPSALPTTNQVLSATAISGTDVTLGWANNSGGGGGGSTNLLSINETVDNSANATAADVGEMVVSVSANKNYYFVIGLIARSTDNGSDLDLSFSVPTGTTMRYTAIGEAGNFQGGLALSGSEATTSLVNLNATNVDCFVRISGIIKVGGTAGSIQLRLARNGGTGTVSIQTNSYFYASTN